jgi:hypothetical protein
MLHSLLRYVTIFPACPPTPKEREKEREREREREREKECVNTVAGRQVKD